MGGWRSGETGIEPKVREWDLGAAATNAGPVRVTFQYTSGAHRLDIEWAEVVVDGKPLARDAHTGVTGAKSQANTHAFTLPPPGSRRILLRALVRSDGGSDSNGEILLETVR